jgi:hypothetical protein
LTQEPVLDTVASYLRNCVINGRMKSIICLNPRAEVDRLLRIHHKGVTDDDVHR